MAVNKNFVVKNGLEVNSDLLLADATNSRVGVGTSVPSYTLHVLGGIGATDLRVTGVTTLSSDLKVGAGGTGFVVVTDASTGAGRSVGIRTDLPEYTLDVRGPVSTGTTALYVYGDTRITGDLFVDDIPFDDATMQDLTVTDTLTVAGVTTLASSGGITTTGGQLYVGTELSVSGVTSLSTLEVSSTVTATDKEIYTQFDITNNGSSAFQYASTGIGFTEATDNPTISLVRGKKYHFSVNASGHPFQIQTSYQNTSGTAFVDGITNNGAAVGVVTFKVPFNAPDTLYYQCTNHVGMAGTFIIGGQGLGIRSEGTTIIERGVTDINFASTNGTAITVDTNNSVGIATVTFAPGVSLGLAIALGG